MLYFMNSSAVTGFFFCSEQYPAADELVTYLENNLTYMIERSDYITAAALYASASNTYVFDQTAKIEQSELNSILNDMIYNYNSNALDKNKLASNGFNTFLFKYENYVVFSKDLTTLSGTSYSTMFFLMDSDAFSAFIYRANGMIPYKVSIYDSHNTLLFSNSDQTRKENYAQLINFITEDVSSSQRGTSNYIYCKSDITGLQYLLEMEQLPLPGNIKNSPFMYLSIIFVSLILTFVLFYLLYYGARKSLTTVRNITKNLEISFSTSPAKLSEQLNQKVSSLVLENNTLKNIIEATSTEALSHLFTKVIAGEAIEPGEAEITLSSTGYGFRLDDIYIAGIVHQTIANCITSDNRQRILNMLNSIFGKFKEKNQCTLCAFLYDEKSIVIIASFPAGTSIAKGKAKINALTQQINEGITFLNLPMAIAFGHMYSSILDLSFSYNEAFKAMHYQIEELSSTFPLGPPIEHTFIESEQPMGTNELLPIAQQSVSENHPIRVSTETWDSPDISDTAERIDRRASQIAQLIWESKEDGLPSLINRTMTNFWFCQ